MHLALQKRVNLIIGTALEVWAVRFVSGKIYLAPRVEGCTIQYNNVMCSIKKQCLLTHKVLRGLHNTKSIGAERFTCS